MEKYKPRVSDPEMLKCAIDDIVSHTDKAKNVVVSFNLSVAKFRSIKNGLNAICL